MNLDDLLPLDSYPGLIPGILISLAAGLILGRRVGRLLGVGRLRGSALVVAVGTVLSATLTPGGATLGSGALGTGACDLGRVGLATASQVMRGGEIALNIALFIPLGLALGQVPSSRVKTAGVSLAAGLPLAIEAVQLVAVPLGRECQSGDVIDNLTGLVLGLVIATAIRWIVTARSGTGRTGPGLRAGAAALAASALVMALLFAIPPAASPTGAVPTPTHKRGPTTEPGPTSGASVRVDSIPALLRSLADNAVTDIVVADGSYTVSPASTQGTNSLWIGSRFARRTRPVTVRAETHGGVTFDGAGTSTFGGITFVEGAHDQTWDGFTFADGTPTSTGVVVFGGYPGKAAPHHITLRNITIAGSVTSASDGATDQGVYFSQALGGPHDILIDGLTVDGAGGLDSALHFYRSDGTNANAWNVTVRRLQVSGTEQAIMLWDPTLRDIVIDGAKITDALDVAVRYESPGASGIVLANITSTGSGSGEGFKSSLGDAPPGVTFTNNSFR